MSAFLISCLMFALVLTGSCSAPTTTSTVDAKGPWSLRLTTSGGFVGIGRGNFSVDSEGKFDCELMNREQVRKGVTGTVNRSELQTLIEAVSHAEPKGWNKPGLNVAAPDAFGYKLELRTGSNDAQPFKVEWYDNTADQLPADLKELSSSLLQTMDRLCKLR